MNKEEKEGICEEINRLKNQVDELDEDIYDVHERLVNTSESDKRWAMVGELLLLGLIFIIGVLIGSLVG